MTYQETNQEIRVGAVVVLKSGGPQMTVMRMDGAPVCRWFYKGEVKEAAFEHGGLLLAKDRPKLVEQE